MIDAKKYGKLLDNTIPSLIEDNPEYDRLEGVFEGLINKPRSPEEDKLFDLLAHLLEDYEQRTLPPLAKEKGAEMLKFLMAENGLNQSDLAYIFSSQGIVSEILSGKRQINIAHAKKLGARFKVSPELFLDI